MGVVVDADRVTSRIGRSNLSYGNVCVKDRAISLYQERMQDDAGNGERPRSISLETVTGSDRDDLIREGTAKCGIVSTAVRIKTDTCQTRPSTHLETNVLELLSLQNVPSVKDKGGLVHGVVDRLPVQGDELLPLGDDDDGWKTTRKAELPISIEPQNLFGSKCCSPSAPLQASKALSQTVTAFLMGSAGFEP